MTKRASGPSEWAMKWANYTANDMKIACRNPEANAFVVLAKALDRAKQAGREEVSCSFSGGPAKVRKKIAIILNDSQAKSLRNCYLLAAREFHKSKDPNWEYVMRFCKEGGIVPSPLRGAR